MKVWIALLLDVVLVLAFAALGRASHAEDPLGALVTAWPFLVALAAGWAIARAWRAPSALWPVGVVVWVTTTALGLALRGVTGGGLSGAFPIVATVTLAVFLLGWRAIAALVARSRRTSA